MSDSLLPIVEGGYCIGCGACSAATHSALPMQLSPIGTYRPSFAALANLSAEQTEQAVTVCPFSNVGPNETEIGQTLYRESATFDLRLGYYAELCVGHVSEVPYRERGSSGGVLTWILVELLATGAVDAVVHVKRVKSGDDNTLFRYAISRTISEVQNGAKSRYYPIELSGVLDEIRTKPGRYVVVGLPCFIKAVRRLTRVDETLQQRILYCVGLVCGHLKSQAFADSLAWQVGIQPGQLHQIDFRVKLPDRPSGDYGVQLIGGGIDTIRPIRELLGANWGHNFFRYSACDFCDDVFAETADMAVGDAWLPEYEQDSGGNSVVVVRHPHLQALVRQGVADKRLHFDAVDADKIAQSQAGGLRDRREGLAYRLYLKKRSQKWAPQKRVEPEHRHLTSQRARVYAARSVAGQASHKLWQKAVQAGRFEVFRIGISPYIRRVQRAYQPYWKRLLGMLVDWVRGWSKS